MTKATKIPAPKEAGVIKVKIVLSPTGKFSLGYSPGEVATLPELQATELIEAGYAELVK